MHRLSVRHFQNLDQRLHTLLLTIEVQGGVIQAEKINFDKVVSTVDTNLFDVNNVFSTILWDVFMINLKLKNTGILGLN